MQQPTRNAWHLSRNGKTYGPYTWEQMAEHARGGRIGRADKVFDPRSGAWAKSAKVPGLFGPGGFAAAPAGLSAAAKAIAFLAISFAVLIGGAAYFSYALPGGPWLRVFDADEGKDPIAGVAEFVNRDDVTTSQRAEIPPEGLAYKGTFRWESREGAGVPNLWHDDPCWLWIYTNDEGTAASFDFGTVDGWPVYLVSQTGSHYVFESSERSMVERVRISVTAGSSTMSGNVTNINHVGSFESGTFSGSAISYEEYQAEAP